MDAEPENPYDIFTIRLSGIINVNYIEIKCLTFVKNWQHEQIYEILLKKKL